MGTARAVARAHRADVRWGCRGTRAEQMTTSRSPAACRCAVERGGVAGGLACVSSVIHPGGRHVEQRAIGGALRWHAQRTGAAHRCGGVGARWHHDEDIGRSVRGRAPRRQRPSSRARGVDSGATRRVVDEPVRRGTVLVATLDGMGEVATYRDALAVAGHSPPARILRASDETPDDLHEGVELVVVHPVSGVLHELGAVVVER